MPQFTPLRMESCAATGGIRSRTWSRAAVVNSCFTMMLPAWAGAYRHRRGRNKRGLFPQGVDREAIRVKSRRRLREPISLYALFEMSRKDTDRAGLSKSRCWTGKPLPAAALTRKGFPPHWQTSTGVAALQKTKRWDEGNAGAWPRLA